MNMRSKSSVNLLSEPSNWNSKLLDNYQSVPMSRRDTILLNDDLCRASDKLFPHGKTENTCSNQPQTIKDSIKNRPSEFLFSKAIGIGNSSKCSTNWRNKENSKIQTKSVYEKYKERIEGGLAIASFNSLKNPQLKFLKQENEELKIQMMSDIERLRLARQKSEKSLRKCESSNLLLPSKPRSHVTIDPRSIKMRVAEKQREKLSRVR